jgi:NADH-quinone oxidoreductase subunit E
VNEILQKYPEEIQQILAKYPAAFRKSAVMPLMFLAQCNGNYITKQAIADVAELTGLSMTDVDSVVGFYTLYHETAGGRFRLQVCTDMPCALMGAEAFLQNLCANIGVKVGETTADGLFTIEEVTCLAGCHRAPMLQVQSESGIEYHESLTVETTLDLVTQLRKQAQEEVK